MATPAATDSARAAELLWVARRHVAQQEWLAAAAALIRAVPLSGDDPTARELLTRILPFLAAGHPDVARRAQGLLTGARRPRRAARAAASTAQPHTTVARTVWVPAAGFKRAAAYFNTVVAALLAVILTAGGGSIGGTFAYFSNASQLTGNTVTAGSLATPSINSIDCSGDPIQLTWASAGYADTTYEVYSASDTSGPWALAATTNTTSTMVPKASFGTKYLRVIGLAGKQWSSNYSASQSCTSSAAPSVAITPTDTTTGVVTSGYVRLVFSEPMVTSTVAVSMLECQDGAPCGSTQAISGGGSSNASAPTWTADATVASFDYTSLPTMTYFKVAITAGTDRELLSLTAPTSSVFQTGDNTHFTRTGVSSPTSGVVAPAAGLYPDLRAETTGLVDAVRFEISGPTSATNCVTGGSPYVWTWNNGSAANGSYNFSVTALSGGCGGATLETRSGGSFTVANPATVSLSPAPNEQTLASNGTTSVCLYATVRDSRGDLVANGAQVAWSFTTDPVAGNFTLATASESASGTSASGVDTTVGTSHSDCTAGLGQAVAKITLNSGALTTISITATSGSATGTTRINDPPGAPSDLELEPGSIKVKFKPATTPNVDGYYVLIGTESGKYSRQIDVKKATSVHIEDGIVGGRRYFVAVQSYDKLGQTSALSNEASIVAPAHAAAAAVALTATPLTAGAPLRNGATITAKVTDSRGNAAGGHVVKFSAPAGITLSPAQATANAEGVATTSMTVSDQTLVAVLIQASASSATGSVDVPLASPTATASPSPSPSATPVGTATPTLSPIQTPTSTVLVSAPGGGAPGAPVTGTSVNGGTSSGLGAPASGTSGTSATSGAGGATGSGLVAGTTTTFAIDGGSQAPTATPTVGTASSPAAASVTPAATAAVTPSAGALTSQTPPAGATATPAPSGGPGTLSSPAPTTAAGQATGVPSAGGQAAPTQPAAATAGASAGSGSTTAGGAAAGSTPSGGATGGGTTSTGSAGSTTTTSGTSSGASGTPSGGQAPATGESSSGSSTTTGSVPSGASSTGGTTGSVQAGGSSGGSASGSTSGGSTGTSSGSSTSGGSTPSGSSSGASGSSGGSSTSGGSTTSSQSAPAGSTPSSG